MKIVVLAGGTSTERSVSITSGTMVCKALREKNHQAVLVDIFCGIEVNGNLEEAFAEENYEEIIEINFKQIPSAMDIFSSDLKVDNMVMAMSVFDDGKCKSIR